MYFTRQKILTISIVVILFSLLACEEKKQPQEYLAKVGNKILTEEGLENYLSQDKYAKKFKNEFVREWINEELLFLEAEKSEFTKSKQYLNLMETAKKQIASSLILDNYFEENLSRPSVSQLNFLYDSIKENLVSVDDAYILNIAEFDDEQKADDFRLTAIKNGWQNSIALIKNDSSTISVLDESFNYGYSISPLELSRIVKVLNPDEISLVIRKEPSLFTVVQMVKVIDKNTVPDFELVKEQVEEIYYFEKRKELFSKYLEQLYSKYNVELKKVNE